MLVNRKVFEDNGYAPPLKVLIRVCVRPKASALHADLRARGGRYSCDKLSVCQLTSTRDV